MISYSNKSEKHNLIGKEYKNEWYYDRLKRLCNPANFVDNYDKEKVDISNEIYSKLLKINCDDSDEVIHELCVETESKLGINLLNEDDFEKLKDKLNPKNFIEPYDSEKITLANELYSEILQPDINYTKFDCIEKKASPLLTYLKLQEDELRKKHEEELRIKQEVEKKEEKNNRIVALCIVLGAIIIIIIYGLIK